MRYRIENPPQTGRDEHPNSKLETKLHRLNTAPSFLQIFLLIFVGRNLNDDSSLH